MCDCVNNVFLFFGGNIKILKLLNQVAKPLVSTKIMSEEIERIYNCDRLKRKCLKNKSRQKGKS